MTTRDRLAEIRARVDGAIAAEAGPAWTHSGRIVSVEYGAVQTNAWRDITWLIGEVVRLREIEAAAREQQLAIQVISSSLVHEDFEAAWENAGIAKRKLDAVLAKPPIGLLTDAAEHRCVFCGQAHPGCCGRCLEYPKWLASALAVPPTGED